MYIRKNTIDIERVRPRQGRMGYLKLDSNENPEGLPKEFFDKVIKDITPEYIATYPEPEVLEEELASYLDVKPENLLITNGSDEAIKSIFEVFAEEGKELLTVWPTFAMYMVYGNMFGMKHVKVDYDNDFSLDFEKFLGKINKNTGIVSLLNPNNPIGTVYSVEQARRVIEKAAEVDALVVIDEAYHYFYSKTFVNLIKEYDNVIVLRTFSKLCSIAGLRIGYAVANKKLIDLLEKIRQTYNVNTIAIKFAREILKDKDLVVDLINIEHEGREYIINKLKEIGRDYYAQNGNYVFIKCNKNADDVYKELEENMVLVKKYSEPMLKDYIRISTGSKAVMEKFWNIFMEIDK
ncbi:histidinol-phosphate transaminase [Anaerofustis stercorihominis]|uniref:Histidinol-phosphate transaminase n=1 Tax=Anaerofustis stercorihominis TaxID=214853 RepID=A0A3E3E016_9FIRM|nr:histidinol-phosphate transaminase [Anaerofustis stercorihominis]RGD74666.1 histidinol-phosphate transaminase [Anaerofustis stercorihominis]